MKSELPQELSGVPQDFDPQSVSRSEIGRDGQGQGALDKVPWYRSLRTRLAALMTITTLAPIVVFHIIFIQINRANINESIWYLVLIFKTYQN